MTVVSLVSSLWGNISLGWRLVTICSTVLFLVSALSNVAASPFAQGDTLDAVALASDALAKHDRKSAKHLVRSIQDSVGHDDEELLSRLRYREDLFALRRK